MNLVFRALLIGSIIGFSWFAMMTVHEFGHVLHAWCTGGVVERVVLHPARFSRTDLARNPHPLFVAWGGAAWGCLFPAALWALVRAWTPPHAYLARFFVGFCLIANGAYLAAGSFIGAGDAGDLLRNGAAQWQLLSFGMFATAAGLALWNGLGPSFGFADARGIVDRRAAIGMFLALLFIVTALAVLGNDP